MTPIGLPGLLRSRLSARGQSLVRRLRDAQPLPANVRAELAQKRATVIEGTLAAAGADPARITHSTAEPMSNTEAKQVTVQLSLTTH
jgi:hypothetical protein